MSLEPASIIIGIDERVGSMATTRITFAWSDTLRGITRREAREAASRVQIRGETHNKDAIQRTRRGQGGRRGWMLAEEVGVGVGVGGGGVDEGARKQCQLKTMGVASRRPRGVSDHAKIIRVATTDHTLPTMPTYHVKSLAPS